MNNTSKFFEKPNGKTAWRALYLGLATLLVFPALGMYAAVGRTAVTTLTNDTVSIVVGFALAGAGLLLSLLALVTAIRALREGERSWVLWAGLLPAGFVALSWIAMIAGEFLFPH